MFGFGRTTEILVHRNCVGGLNFDYIAGFDLTKDKDIAYLRKYLDATEPEIKIFGALARGA
eukprot:3104433-Pyramimonas_sp.AAC.1